MINKALQEAADNLEITIRKLIKTCNEGEEIYYQTLSCLRESDIRLREILKHGIQVNDK